MNEESIKKSKSDLKIIFGVIGGIFVLGILLILIALVINKTKSSQNLSFRDRWERRIEDFLDSNEYDDVEELYEEDDYPSKPSTRDKSTFEDINEDYVDSLNEITSESTPTTKVIFNDDKDIPVNNNYVYPQPTKPVETPCINYTVEEGYFKSSGCYSYDDYNNLRAYISKYDYADWTYDSAKRTIEITCDSDWEPFEEQCEEAQERKDDAKDDKEYYEKLIFEIIARGK